MVEARWAAAKAYRRRCVLVLLLGMLMDVGKKECPRDIYDVFPILARCLDTAPIIAAPFLAAYYVSLPTRDYRR